MVDPSLLDQEGKFRFVAQEVAAALSAKHRFATHRQSHVIYVYREGVYDPDGEELIREETRRLLGDQATTHRVNEVVAHIRETTFTPPQRFNPPLELICVKNGVLNIWTRELKPHTPDLIFLRKIPVRYDPSAKAPTCGRYFSSWMDAPDVIRAVQFMGFCLFREYFIQKAVLLVGGGGNGKTTFLEHLRRWLGPKNVSSVPAQDLDGSRFGTAKLYGMLGNFVDELPRTAWFKTERFKAITGGGTVEMERKFHDPFDDRPYAKLLYSANLLPMVQDDTVAFWERIDLISFPHHFDGKKPRDQIWREMLTDTERSGMLNAALAGLQMLRHTGKFHAPEGVDAIRSRYIHASDPAAAFVEDQIVGDPEGIVPKAECYSRYVEYCRQNCYSPTINSIFARLLMRLVPGVRAERAMVEGARTYVWRGIRMKEPSEGAPRSEKNETFGWDVRDISYLFCTSKQSIRYVNKIWRIIGKTPDIPDTPDTFDFSALPSLFAPEMKLGDSPAPPPPQESEGLPEGCIRCGRPWAFRLGERKVCRECYEAGYR